MRDIHYLRAQANLCLDMAALMSDGAAAAELRQQAENYRAEASALETGERSVKADGAAKNGDGREATAASEFKES
jgi:hypothetical protein